VDQTLRRWSGRAIIISLAVFSCVVAVGLSPARGQGNPGAKRRAPAPPSPEEITLRSRAIREAVEQCAALVEAGDHRKAVPMLADLRRALEKQAKGEDDSARMAARELPRVDALVARVALDSKAPDKALDFVRPYVEPRDAYNLDHADCYLVAGDALLALGKPYDALMIFDWMAGQTEGVPLVRAAEGCGRALLARKEFQKALESFRFAVDYAREYAYDQEALIRRLEGLLRDAQRLADMDLYGEDFVRYRDAERLRRQRPQMSPGLTGTNLRDTAAARSVYLEIIQKWPESIYAEASRLYAAQCLVALGKIEEAKQELAAFRASDPYGLYRGEAVLEMGRIALEYDLAPQAAKGCFLLLDTWLREVQDKTPLNIEKLAVREAAEKVTTPPAKEKYTDFWGNVKKNAIQPGQLVNRKTCPWYLDDLKEQMAMYLGFLAFVEGKNDEALAWYKKILECDPTTRRLDTAGEWNDYSRLKWGAEHGYLIAYPQELRLYNERQRLAIVLGDFHYVTQDFDRAADFFTDLLKGKHGMLKSAQRDYPLYAMGMAIYRGRWRPGGNSLKDAVAQWEKVLGNRDGTWTEYRAAYTIANVSRQSADESLRAHGRELLIGLAQTQGTNEFTQKARLALAMDLAKEGQWEAAFALLRHFKEGDGKYFALAQHLIKNAGAWAPGANKEP
jgi:tetratricopeptide (TPR) repeat protein